MGYNIGGTPADPGSREEHTRARHPHSRPQELGPEDDVLEHLIDELTDSTSRSQLLESQTPLVKGPVSDTLGKQDTTTHRYPYDDFDCRKFERDVLDQEYDLRHRGKGIPTFFPSPPLLLPVPPLSFVTNTSNSATANAPPPLPTAPSSTPSTACKRLMNGISLAWVYRFPPPLHLLLHYPPPHNILYRI
ncbi:MAG: hypothetical protein Q9222_007537 [Ikaeria aurantiellina]